MTGRSRLARCTRLFLPGVGTHQIHCGTHQTPRPGARQKSITVASEPIILRFRIVCSGGKGPAGGGATTLFVASVMPPLSASMRSSHATCEAPALAGVTSARAPVPIRTTKTPHRAPLLLRCTVGLCRAPAPIRPLHDRHYRQQRSSRWWFRCVASLAAAAGARCCSCC